MTEPPPNVHLALPGQADNVALVREVLAGLADTIDFGRSLDDVKAAVSEACNNVVVHAYDGEDGPLEVDVRVRPGELEVVVRDYGSGLASRPDDGGHPDTAYRGIGLAVIEALTSQAAYREDGAHGLEVVMLFEIPDRGDYPEVRGEPPSPARGETSDAVVIAIAPPELSAAILNRLVSALAARSGFSIDRLSDAQLVSDALAARVGSFLDGEYVSVGIEALERALVLRVGRLRAGGSADLVAGSALGEIGPVLERLTNELDVSREGEREVLRLVSSDARIAQRSTR